MQKAGQAYRRHGHKPITPAMVREEKLKQPSEAEILFREHMREMDVFLTKEYRFHLERKWRFDFAAILNDGKISRLAFEIEGGTWIGGRHTSGKGFQNDCDKYNSATAMGWTVFRFTTADVMSGKAKEYVRTYLNRVQG